MKRWPSYNRGGTNLKIKEYMPMCRKIGGYRYWMSFRKKGGHWVPAHEIGGHSVLAKEK